jgi:hypothetical protein
MYLLGLSHIDFVLSKVKVSLGNGLGALDLDNIYLRATSDSAPLLHVLASASARNRTVLKVGVMKGAYVSQTERCEPLLCLTENGDVQQHQTNNNLSLTDVEGVIDFVHQTQLLAPDSIWYDMEVFHDPAETEHRLDTSTCDVHVAQSGIVIASIRLCTSNQVLDTWLQCISAGRLPIYGRGTPSGVQFDTSWYVTLKHCSVSVAVPISGVVAPSPSRATRSSRYTFLSLHCNESTVHGFNASMNFAHCDMLSSNIATEVGSKSLEWLRAEHVHFSMSPEALSPISLSLQRLDLTFCPLVLVAPIDAAAKILQYVKRRTWKDQNQDPVDEKSAGFVPPLDDHRAAMILDAPLRVVPDRRTTFSLTINDTSISIPVGMLDSFYTSESWEFIQHFEAMVAAHSELSPTRYAWEEYSIQIPLIMLQTFEDGANHAMEATGPGLSLTASSTHVSRLDGWARGNTFSV